ncbi:carboxylesterase [Lentinula raphanica]|nr:carboxylesterase [Lentinula raphanica]
MILLRAFVFASASICVARAHTSRGLVSNSSDSYSHPSSTATTNGSLDGLTVSTQQGPVMGTLPMSNVRQFLGIPYAQANRWEAPSSPPNRTTTFDASSFGDSCPQQLNPGNLEFLRLSWGGLSDEEIFVPESEDCLNLNIWAPSIDRAQNAAVLVWIYGGSMSFGTSNTPQYNGLNIVRDNDDIIVVSFNYRTNVFGQPNAPQLNGTGKAQNFGFLDVDSAIGWVYQNIASFGGDPTRITIFGQSAGAELADAYSYSHPNDTIVKGIIQQSGSLLGNGAVEAATATQNVLNDTAWNAVASAVGCGNTSNSEQFSCMQNVSTSDLATAASNTSLQFSIVFDGVTVFLDTKARAASGKFLRVPVIEGTTTNEGDIFIAIAELVAGGVTLEPAFDILSSIYTLQSLCPASESIGYRAAAGVSIFRYEYQAIFPNISPMPPLRAYHTSEIPMVFGTYNISVNATNLPSTPIEIALSKIMQHVWVAFARDPQNALPSMGWPAYDSNTQTIAALGNYQNRTGWTFTHSNVTDVLCPNLTLFNGMFEQVEGLLTSLG